MTTYVRTIKTFHKPDCPALKRAKAIHDWLWMDVNGHLDPVGYGRAVRGAPQYVQACRRCFPAVARCENAGCGTGAALDAMGECPRCGARS